MSNKGPHVKMGNRVPKELDKQLPFMGCKLGWKKSFVPIFSKWILNYEIVFDKLTHGNCAMETKLRWSGHRERGWLLCRQLRIAGVLSCLMVTDACDAFCEGMIN
ncbi:hypothetical protein CDAR_53981 [Caerostris darwini]|uniref:Uncharacterized protein n=1 Tax=Caerostris darwini TaxID=1538125 RepID=A0AAV4WF70_9ARAC|nr:hypothetical protein CDAR_53981 [Caerostris darwini]